MVRRRTAGEHGSVQSRWYARSKIFVASVAVAACTAGLAACGGGASSPAKSGSSSNSGGNSAQGGALNFILSSPFTGASDFIGPLFNAPVQIACKQINKAGGILGHQCAIVHVDSKSDPADAVAALHQALAQHQNVVEALGLGSSTGPAEVPIIAKSHIVAMSGAGESSFLHPAKVVGSGNTKYLYMLQPPDELTGFAFAFAAAKEGLKHPALVFTNAPGVAPVIAGIKLAAKDLGIKPVIDLTLPAKQSSYGSEVHRLVSAHPDLIMTEMDPQTTGTFFQDLVTQTGGKLKVPFMSDDNSLNQPYYKAVVAAIGKKAFFKLGTVVSPGSAKKTPALSILAKQFPAYHTGTPLSSAFTAPLYDGVTLAALAMDVTKSTKPSVFAPEIAKLENGVPGAVTVHTYAAGKAAIRKGKKIKYVGAAGPLNWTASHVRFVRFEVDSFTLSGSTLGQKPTGVGVSAAHMESVLNLKG